MAVSREEKEGAVPLLRLFDHERSTEAMETLERADVDWRATVEGEDRLKLFKLCRFVQERRRERDARCANEWTGKRVDLEKPGSESVVWEFENPGFSPRWLVFCGLPLSFSLSLILSGAGKTWTSKFGDAIVPTSLMLLQRQVPR